MTVRRCCWAGVVICWACAIPHGSVAARGSGVEWPAGSPADSLVSAGLDSLLPELAVRADSLADLLLYSRALDTALAGLGRARVCCARDPETLVPWLLRVAELELEKEHAAPADSLFSEALALEALRGQEGWGGALAARRGLVRVLIEREAFADVEPIVRECVPLARALPDSEGTGEACDLAMLATAFIGLKRYDAAAATLEEAAQIVARSVTVTTSDSAGAAVRARLAIARARARLAEGQNDFAAALIASQEALALFEQWRGPDALGLLPYLKAVGHVHEDLGNLDEAEAAYLRGLAILERTAVPDHPEAALLYNNLGVVRNRKGKTWEAVEAYRRALELRRIHGEDQVPEAALTMVNLSACLRGMGQNAESIQLLRRAVGIYESTFGPEHARTIWAVSHLAQSERQRGNLEAAEGLFRRCVRVEEQRSGPDDKDVALYKVGVAQCLRDQRRFDEARVLFEEVIATFTKVFGADHSEVARMERELAAVLLLMGRRVEARRLFEKAMAVLEARLGSDHPALDRCLAGLTVVSLMEGDLQAAGTYADRNLALAEHNFGEMGLRRSLLLKAGVHAARGQWEAAAAHAMRAAEVALAKQEEIYAVSSEHEVLLFAQAQGRVMETLLAIVRGAPVLADSTLRHAFTIVAREHGQVVDRLAQQRRFLELAADTGGVGQLQATYADAVRQLAGLMNRGPGADPDQHERQLLELREAKEEAERALAEVSERFRTQADARAAERRLSPATLAGELEPGDVLLQFARCPRLRLEAADWASGAVSIEDALFSGGGERYGAFRLRVKEGGAWDLDFVDLGEADSLDAMIERYRRELMRVVPGTRATAREEAEYRTIAKELYRDLWLPLMGSARPREPDPGGTVHPQVYLLPEDRLHLVDFNTLLSPDGELIIERWRLHLLSSARDLLQVRETPAPEGRGLLAVGNPAAGAWSEASGIPSTPLPGAAAEVRAIEKLFTGSADEPATILLGAAATEAAVKSGVQGRRILHLATHGFFRVPPEEGGGEVDAAELEASPLLRCGLVLAPAAQEEDGLLTAQEIVALDLRGLDWVILSACNSGLGAMIPGEGLYGLRRAFEIAGARSVIMSLWGIADEIACDLMQRLYRYRLANATTAEALRLAELERLRRERDRGRLHPAGWAGFVVEGDWR